MTLKKLFFWLMALGLMLQTSALADQPSANSITWLTYDQAQQANPNPDRKLFLYFYADWCSYCRKMEKETFSDPKVIAFINQHFTPVRVNSDQQKEIASRFGVSGLPDLRFLTPKGELIARWPGYIQVPQFIPLLKYIQSDSYLKMKYADFLKQPS